MTDQWNEYYNYERPYESLDNMTPMEYREMKQEREENIDIIV